LALGDLMFKVLGSSFLDIFKKPLNLLYCYLLFLIFTLGYGLIVEYTIDYIPTAEVALISQILYIIKYYFWVFLVYFAFFLLLVYVVSVFITYVINKRLDQKQRTLGMGKVFGYTLFLTILGLIPNVFLSMFGFNVYLLILSILISLLYVFIVFPYLFLMPILLVFNDLKTSLSESFKFAKKHYGWILVLQFLAVILLSVLSQIFDYLSIFLSEFISTILFLLVITILFLWGLNFIYNWYSSEKS